MLQSVLILVKASFFCIFMSLSKMFGFFCARSPLNQEKHPQYIYIYIYSQQFHKKFEMTNCY